MSSRKSDHLPYPSDTDDSAPWRSTLLANVPLLVVLLAAMLVGMVLEGDWGRDNISDYVRRVPMLIGFNIILAVSLQLINGFSGQFSLGHAGFMAVGAYVAAFPALQYSDHYANPGAILIFFVALGISVGLGAVAPWILFVLIRKTRKLHKTLPALLLIGLFLWIVIDFASASRYEATPVLAIWSQLLHGLEWLFAALIEHLAPIAARIFSIVPQAFRQPLSFIFLLAGAASCAAAVGFIVGLPALRLRGDYLAIATLGFGEIIRIAIQNSPPLGGALGLVAIPRYTNFAWLYVAVILTITVIWRVAYSPKGRAIMAVREDEIAASSIGINTTTYKVTAFTIGAFFAGLAGALYSLHESSITPSSFGIIKSIEPVVMVTLGGLGSISGAILAAIILTLLPEVLRSISPDERMVIYSLLLVVMMILRPQGLLDGRELWPKKWTRRPKPPAATSKPEAVPV